MVRTAHMHWVPPQLALAAMGCSVFRSTKRCAFTRIYGRPDYTHRAEIGFDLRTLSEVAPCTSLTVFLCCTRDVVSYSGVLHSRVPSKIMIMSSGVSGGWGSSTQWLGNEVGALIGVSDSTMYRKKMGVYSGSVLEGIQYKESDFRGSQIDRYDGGGTILTAKGQAPRLSAYQYSRRRTSHRRVRKTLKELVWVVASIPT